MFVQSEFLGVCSVDPCIFIVVACILFAGSCNVWQSSVEIRPGISGYFCYVDQPAGTG